MRDFFGLRLDIGGTTAVEYALIAGLIAVVIAVAALYSIFHVKT